MRSVGFGEEHIAAIPAWSTSDVFSPVERAVLAYTDELVLQGGRVQDASFDALRDHLSEEEILELTYITLTYELHATMCRALRLEYDDVAERIVEIEAPAEAANRDIMADISRPEQR
jgi:alkylhydroperoxidase family enzyme